MSLRGIDSTIELRLVGGKFTWVKYLHTRFHKAMLEIKKLVLPVDTRVLALTLRGFRGELEKHTNSLNEGQW